MLVTAYRRDVIMLKWITHFTRKIESAAVDAGLVYRFACLYYRDVVEREIELADITDKDHVLCIGGGICPFSAILFHQLTGAKVTVIDNNSDCVPKARRVISRLGLDSYIKVLCQDGKNESTNYADYTVVHLALQISPLERVFYQAQQHAAQGAKILIRRPKAHLKHMYGKLANPLLSDCSYITHKSRNIGSTLLYTKHAS